MASLQAASSGDLRSYNNRTTFSAPNRRII